MTCEGEGTVSQSRFHSGSTAGTHEICVCIFDLKTMLFKRCVIADRAFQLLRFVGRVEDHFLTGGSLCLHPNSKRSLYIYIPLFHSHLLPTKIAALQHPSLFGGVCTAQLGVLETCSRMNLTDQSRPKKSGQCAGGSPEVTRSIHQDKCELDMSGAATWGDIARLSELEG